MNAKDITSKRFEKVKSGYTPDEVDEYLKTVASSYSQLQNVCIQLRKERDDAIARLDTAQREKMQTEEKLQVLATEISKFREDEDALKDALFSAQKEAHRIVNSANEKANAIVAEAHAQSDDIIADAKIFHFGTLSMTHEGVRNATKKALRAAKEAGADYVGLDEYIEKIKGGWTDIDVIITMPSIMGKIGALGRVLGPRGLMPNPKSGTVTMDVAKAVKEVKQGKIDFKVDKSGIVHTSIGKVSFSADQIRDNAKEFISTLNKLKPTAAKGTYIKSIYLSSTMSAGIKIDPKSVEEI